MKIALVTPRSTFLESKMHIPSLGVLYLAARLESLGHETMLYDLNADELPQDGEHDQLWLSSTAPQRADVVRVAQATQGWRTRRVLGGPAAWTHPDAYTGLGFDLVAAGECDTTEAVQSILERADKREGGYAYFPVQPTLDWVLPPVRRWNDRYHANMRDSRGNTYRMTSMFTSRGCMMSCAFCIAEGQRVLMADWSCKPIEDVRVGDMVMGMEEPNGEDRKSRWISPTRVTSTMGRGLRQTIRISTSGLAHDLECTPDHKIFVDDGCSNRWKRADSSIAGGTKVRTVSPSGARSKEWRRGWCAGFVAGDGCVHKRGKKKSYTHITATSRDPEVLDALTEFAKEFGCNFRRFQHNFGTNGSFPTRHEGHTIDAVQCTKHGESESFLATINDEAIFHTDWVLGWLAGIYDAEGGLDKSDCRIHQSHVAMPHVVEKIRRLLGLAGFHFSETVRPQNGMTTFCINKAKFLFACRPILRRKYPQRYNYKSFPKHEVGNVSDAGEQNVYDLTTESHSFIVEGFIVHNCDSGRLGKIWERLVRFEPLSLVEQQIAECAAQGFTGLMYYDDVLPIQKQRTLDIMRLHNKYGMVWRAFMRSDIMCKYGEGFFKALVDGGLIEFFIGVESADNRIKAGIHKGTTIEEDELLLSWARKYGVRAKTSFILGLPGESQESMETTRRWILKHRPERVQVGRLIPLAGTPLTDHPEQYDLTYEKQPPDEWFYSGDNGYGTHSFVSTSHLTVGEIDAFWHKLQDELKAEGISG